MAFNEKEKAIIDFGLKNGKSKQEVEQAIQKFRYGSVEPVKAPMTSAQKLGSFAKGFGKGALESTIETAGLLQKGGQAIIAGIDPTRNFQQVQAETGVPSLKSEQLDQIRELLKSENTAEKAGKISEFVAELIFPVGKAKEVQPLLRKGGEILDTGVEKGKQIVQKGQDVVGDVKTKAMEGVEKLVAEPIQKQYETTLKRTTTQKFDEYANIAQKATTDFKNPTPLEAAGKKAQDALDTIQRKLSTIGQEKGGVLSHAAVGNKKVGNIVVKFRQNLQRYLGNKTVVEGDTKLFNDITNEATKLGDNPSAKDVDKFIDFVQDRIYTGSRDLTVPITDEASGALRKITGELNEALKNQLPDSYRGLNDKYARIVEIRNELNLKLGKEGEKGGALMKRVFSPSDANTKALFEEVKTLTGIDLVDEATLARFMMEVAGDTRQASMLQQLNLPSPTKTGIINWLAERFTKSFNTPEEKLRRARELIGQ